MAKIAIVIPSISGGGSEKSLLGLLQHIPPTTNVIVYHLHGSLNNHSHSHLNAQFRRINAASLRSAKALITLLLDLKREQPSSILAWSRGPAMVLGMLSILFPKSLLTFSCRDYHEIGTTISDKLYLMCLRRFDIIIANSTENLEYLEQRLKDTTIRFLYLRNIIQIKTEPELPPKSTGVKTLCLVGRLEHQKGFDVFINALISLEVKNPIVVKIYGQGTQEGNLKMQLQKLDNDRVTVMWMGFVGNMIDEIAKADLLIMPSRHEGFPNVLLEAFAARTPVLAANCKTGPREIIGNMNERGMLFQSEDCNDLAKQIHIALANPSILCRQIDNATKWLNLHFSEDAVSQNYNDVIELICK